MTIGTQKFQITNVVVSPITITVMEFKDAWVLGVTASTAMGFI